MDDWIDTFHILVVENLGFVSRQLKLLGGSIDESDAVLDGKQKRRASRPEVRVKGDGQLIVDSICRLARKAGAQDSLELFKFISVT